jgi:hypothetical protein
MIASQIPPRVRKAREHIAARSQISAESGVLNSNSKAKTDPAQIGSSGAVALAMRDYVGFSS